MRGSECSETAVVTRTSAAASCDPCGGAGVCVEGSIGALPRLLEESEAVGAADGVVLISLDERGTIACAFTPEEAMGRHHVSINGKA